MIVLDHCSLAFGGHGVEAATGGGTHGIFNAKGKETATFCMGPIQNGGGTFFKFFFVNVYIFLKLVLFRLKNI